jgi:subtilisin-like proprotein convertase family protein
VQDVLARNTGTLNSWSLTIVGNCTALAAPQWSGAAAPDLPTVDNGTACTSVRVPAGTGGDASAAKLDISGSHAHGSALRGTLSHNGVTVEAFPARTFSTGTSTFSFTGRMQPGFTGDPAGTWTLCIADMDAFDDVGTLSTWAVHD